MATTAIQDPAVILSTLRGWTSSKRLRDATLSEKALALDAQQLDPWIKVTLAVGDKSCRYSVASIYLQIVDPDQRLLTYRNACKQHKVSDPVNALDKPTVVSYFYQDGGAASTTDAAAAPVSVKTEDDKEPSAAAASQPAAEDEDDEDALYNDTANATAAAPPAPAPEGERSPTKPSSSSSSRPSEKSSSSKHREHRDRDRDREHRDRDRDRHKHHHKSSSDRKRSHSSSSRHHHGDKDHHKRSHHRVKEESSASEHAKKKKKTEVTNEELFSNLTVVVGKRTVTPAGAPGTKTTATADADHDAAADPENAGGDAAGALTKPPHISEHQWQTMKIAKALSAEGFEPTPELLEEHRISTEHLLNHEIPVGNSASILRAANPRKDLSRVLEIFQETMNPPKPTSRSSSKHHHKSSSGSTGTHQPHLRGKNPVIIVPKGMTSPLTMLNAHEFLAKGKFVPRDAWLKQFGKTKKPETVVERPFSKNRAASSSNNNPATRLLKYELLDNPQKLGRNPHEWDRIVAVIALGQEWQFKDWIPPYNTPVHLFHKAFGFYVSLEGHQIPNSVMTWSVKRAKLHRDKRGLDSITHTAFWNGLEEWMMVHKRGILPPEDESMM